MSHLLRLIFLCSALILAWYIAADRMTPFTSNARVKAIVTPIVPQVSGLVISVSAANAALVNSGDPLVQIDQRPFDIARNQAVAAVDAAAQALGVNAAAVEAAQARLTQSRADQKTVRLQTARVFELERKGLVPTATADDARNQVTEAETAVALAETELERARQALGPDGAGNPQLRQALANLARADLDLDHTTLRAPAKGSVVDLTIAEGAYARAGQPLMQFVDARDVWIEAYMTENNLSQLDVGDRALVVLDIHPGRVLEAQVQSISGAVSVASAGPDGLPNPPNQSGWLRQPQRFPVRLILPNYRAGDADDDVRFALNGQADVVVFTSDSPFMNALGDAYIRAVAFASYAY